MHKGRDRIRQTQEDIDEGINGICELKSALNAMLHFNSLHKDFFHQNFCHDRRTTPKSNIIR